MACDRQRDNISAGKHKTNSDKLGIRRVREIIIETRSEKQRKRRENISSVEKASSAAAYNAAAAALSWRSSKAIKAALRRDV